VDLLVSYQSNDGGYSEYEPSRVGDWIEYLNPATNLNNVMKSYSFPECTSSVVTGLHLFTQHHPEYRQEEIKECIRKAVIYIKRKQRHDGSWYGTWGICFTYATMFTLDCLQKLGETYENSDCIRRAVHFLLSIQKKDGGWGESYKSSTTLNYVEHEKSQIVHTAYACIALMSAQYPDRKPIERGLKVIMSRQKVHGEWPAESAEGNFLENGTLTYQNYKFIWAIKALGMFITMYGDVVI